MIIFFFRRKDGKVSAVNNQGKVLYTVNFSHQIMKSWSKFNILFTIIVIIITVSEIKQIILLFRILRKHEYSFKRVFVQWFMFNMHALQYLQYFWQICEIRLKQNLNRIQLHYFQINFIFMIPHRQWMWLASFNPFCFIQSMLKKSVTDKLWWQLYCTFYYQILVFRCHDHLFKFPIISL